MANVTFFLTIISQMLICNSKQNYSETSRQPIGDSLIARDKTLYFNQKVLIFSYSAMKKLMLWVLIRSALQRCF